MITIEQAKLLKLGEIIYGDFALNSDGTPIRWKINGKIKLWKTRPDEFSIPIKHGLYDYGYLNSLNNDKFFKNKDEALEKYRLVLNK